jgi:hypothetical protein
MRWITRIELHTVRRVGKSLQVGEMNFPDDYCVDHAKRVLEGQSLILFWVGYTPTTLDFSYLTDGERIWHVLRLDSNHYWQQHTWVEVGVSRDEFEEKMRKFSASLMGMDK